MSFLSPLDLLAVPSNEQDVIRCLSRRPDLTKKEIASFTKIPLDELDSLLEGMLRSARLTQDDKNRFQVSYSKNRTSPQRGAKTGLLDSLFG